jgi:uncharacterized membrane protein YkoI
MFTIVSNGDIQLTRGDTARFTVAINNNGQPYTVQEDDVITLTVKATYEDTKALIEKKITGDDLIHIKPIDTKGLDFGRYVYDVQLTTADGDNYTVVADKTFTIANEVG